MTSSSENTSAPLGASRAMALVGVANLARARMFYEGVLGLTVHSADMFAVVVLSGGMKIRLTQVPAVMPAGYTVLGFEVADTSGTVARLAAAGVTFERFAFLGPAQSPDGIWTAPDGTRVAWFKDPDGNLLSVSDTA